MINDLKAPRFNSRTYRHNIVSEDLYERWKVKTGRTETFKEFKEVWYKIAEIMTESMVEEADGLRLPKGLGDIYMGYVPGMKRKPVDYQASMKHGFIVRHENWDTNQKTGKIIYGTNRRKYLYKLHRWWSFVACRNMKKRIAKGFRDHPERYKNSIEKRTGK